MANNMIGGPPQGIPINPAQLPQTPGRVRPGQTAPSAPSVPTAPTPPTPPPQAKPAAPTIARALTVADIRSHLISIGVEPSDFNTRLSSAMVRRGVELSSENFKAINQMLQGTNKSQAMQEAAMLLIQKGINDPQAVKVLGEYFSQNPGLAAQLNGLQEGLGNLVSALAMGKSLLTPQFVSQLSALLASFDDSFRNILEKFSGAKGLHRPDFIVDVRALKALLQGVQEKAPQAGTPEAEALSSALMQFQGKLDSVMQNLLAQAILSNTGRENVNYQYHQIPNALTKPPRDFEIVIKREGEGKQSEVDPRNTQVVMSLETENMGKIVISCYVKDKKVYVVFVFSEKTDGQKGRELIAREFGDLQQRLANRAYMVTGYQVKVDPAMCSIKPYLIPMLAKLDEVMKKIDLEA